jgi:3-methyladenine DNA glycosylase AlkC
MEALLKEMESWSQGNPLEQRAAAAALCEPALLQNKQHVEWVLRILDHITASLTGVENRRAEPFHVLKKGLAYCWSVAVAAHPEAGKTAMERWLSSDDADVRWIMKENLKKNRLLRVEPEWAAAWSARLQA